MFTPCPILKSSQQFLPKLQGARIILDIHDIVPSSMSANSIVMEKASSSRHWWWWSAFPANTPTMSLYPIIYGRRSSSPRSVESNKCTVIMITRMNPFFIEDHGREMMISSLWFTPGTLGLASGFGHCPFRHFASIKDQVPDAEFHMYGRGPEKKNLEALIVELDLESRVFIKETMPIEQIARVMANSDLGIIPKRNDPFGGRPSAPKYLNLCLWVFRWLSQKQRSIGSILMIRYWNSSILKMWMVWRNACFQWEMIRYCVIASAKNAQRFVESYSWEKRKQEYLKLVDSLTKEKDGSNHR